MNDLSFHWAFFKDLILILTLITKDLNSLLYLLSKVHTKASSVFLEAAGPMRKMSVEVLCYFMVVLTIDFLNEWWTIGVNNVFFNKELFN